MFVLSRVTPWMCFFCVAFTVIAPGLINILVNHEDMGAFRQEAKK